jgi:hypothetical protein
MARTEMSKAEWGAQWTRDILSRGFKYESMANVEIVVNATLRANPDPSAGDYAAMAEKLAEQGTLAVNPAWSEPFEQFYAAYPQYAGIYANEGILIQALLAEKATLNFDNLVYVAGIPEVAASLGVREEYARAAEAQKHADAKAERERVEAEAIRSEMLSWLTGGPREKQLQQAGAYPTIFPMEVKKETARLAALNHAQLVEEVTRRRDVRRIKNLSKEDYRAEVTISRAAGQQPVIQPKMQQSLNQYETLPAQYTTRSGLTVDMNRAGVLKVANTDSFAFRELVRRFGADSINDILAGRV